MLQGHYKTKKDLKASIGTPLHYTETSVFGAEYSDNIQGLCLVGPGSLRKWYAQVWIVNGLITQVT